MRGLILAFTFFSVQAFANEAFTSKTFQDLYTRAIVEGQAAGIDHVLVVYDMDNTLLAMNQDLGSDQWFDWQSAINGDAANPDRVALDFDSLLALEAKLYALSGMHLTGPDVASTIANLHQLGFRQMVLSSRGPDVRDVSIRELKKNGITFDWSASLATVTTYTPYNLNAPEESCLTAQDIANLKLGKPRPVSFGNGVMMTNGLHKGAMLRSFLCQDPMITTILFIDDKAKNTDAVQAAYAGSNRVQVVTYRYAEEDAKVAAFHAGDKSNARSAWNALKAVLGPLFGN